MNRAIQMLEVEEIIAIFSDDASMKYKSADWLMSPFESSVWRIELKSKIQIDWRIPLEDGRLLTDQRHRSTLTALKCWLIAQTHADLTGGSILALGTVHNTINRCLHCIDYFLIRSHKFAIARHGLRNITSNDLKAALALICSERSVANSIYEWPKRLSAFLRKSIAESNLSIAPLSILDEPIPERDDCLLDLSEDEIRKARVWLYANGLYEGGGNSYTLLVKQRKLAAKIYPTSLRATTTRMTQAGELCVGVLSRHEREYASAPVASTHDKRTSKRTAALYLSTLKSIRLLDLAGIPGPVFDPSRLDSALKAADLKDNGRFLSLPYTTVLKALRRAIEYFLEQGDQIVDLYLNVCLVAQRDKISAQDAFDQINARDTSSFQPKSWSISPTARAGSDPVNYFVDLRSSPGLYEKLVILIGAIRIAVGALTARRRSEVSELRAGSTLDKSRTRIIFVNGKSGIGEHREKIARPVPPLIVRMIDLLERLHSGMVLYGVALPGERLFSYPRLWGAPALSANFLRPLDLFCDWAETDIDDEGRRYYIRHHQLRRFFATLFFYGDGFGGLDTLRWFLGHLDAQHVWHYITENVPGDAIRSVAAEFAAYNVRHKTNEASKLSDLLEREFGTNDFSTIDEEALTDYLHELLEDELISVQPKFLDQGRKYRVAILVRGD